MRYTSSSLSMSPPLTVFCLLSCWHMVVSNTNGSNNKNNNIFVRAEELQESINHYSIDGSNNNLQFLDWGKRETARIRFLPNASGYYDAASGIPRDEENSQLPSARRIMEQVFSQAVPKTDKGSNHLLLEFGHFMVQDTIGRTLMNETEDFPMPCDGEVQDVVFCPVTGKSYSIPFSRSQHTNANAFARASVNGETAFLDMSNLYGNTPEVQAEVRSFKDGKIDLDELGLPPIIDKYNSSPGVFAVYCIFLRYHNVLADEFKKENASLSDEELFQMARHRNIAIYQFNAEEKYIPTLLGTKLDEFTEYNPNVDPSIDEFFAAASFRYAHSSFSGLVRMLDANFDPIAADPLILRDVFRQASPNNVPLVIRRHGGIEVFLRGLTITNAKAMDSSFVKDMNYFTEATSLLDVQRGRDLGLPSYNDAREAFGLSRVASFEELTGYDYTEVATALKHLYNGDIDKVDAYVGALVEEADEELGPLFTLSIKNQFERLRDGDRLWYRNRYDRDEWESFPSLSEIIKLTCDDMENFPSESFITWDGVVAGEGDETCGASTQLSLINGAFSLGWQIEVPSAADTSVEPDLGGTIEVTLIANERMNAPGFLGVGWRSQVMRGAEIWWCTVNSEPFAAETFPSSCDGTTSKMDVEPKMFSCCVSPGQLHVQPVCSNENDAVHYELTVIDWCLTPESSRVIVSAPVCADDDDSAFVDGKVNCFRTTSNENGEMEFIVAYNHNRIGNHGYQMRTGAAVDLSAGILTQSEAHVADTGLIATHAVFMLFGWCVLTPIAIFIVRYMKTRSWRLVAHVSLMGIVGSLMVPLLIGVEASVGATDKTQEHSAVGLFLLIVYFAMVFAGRVRYLKLQGRKVGRKTYFWSALLHKYGGIIMVFLAWWNCYTGLVRIGPEDSFFQVFVLSSFPLGYDLPIFGVLRQYVFFPYLGFVCLVFAIAEGRRYQMNNSTHAGKLKGILEGKETIWDDDADQFLDKMTMESFLEATKLGSSLCIVDGYVLDITNFLENHPGGQHLLRYAAGSDITEEFVGARDVDGMKHVHSHSALELMKTFVKAVLVDDGNKKLSFLKGASSRAALSHSSQSASSQNGRRASRFSLVKQPTSRRVTSAFRRGRVVGMRYLTPDIEITHSSKPVILLQLALPKARSDLQVQKLISLPSCAFTFRGVDRNRVAVDRQYTPVKINNDYVVRRSFQSQHNDEEVFDFIISLVPGGKLSKILLDTRMGKMMLAQGPTVNQEVVQVFRTGGWKSVIMIAAGTGVSPMLQVIDFYLSRLSSEFTGVESRLDSACPDLYLMWIVKGPKYDYSEALALDTRVERSQGKFKYTVIYSSSKEKSGLDGETKPAKPSKPSHGWNFKQIIDKTVPSRDVLTGRFGISEKLGMVKPKKVKRHVVDAAWKLKRGTSMKASKVLSMKAGAAKASARKDWILTGNSMLESADGAFDDSSINNEITAETWNGEVQSHYRAYGKPLLEELLKSISSDVGQGEQQRASSSEMPPIVEEAKSDSESDFCSGSDIPADITLETESSPETSNESIMEEEEQDLEEKEQDIEDGIPWLPQRREDRTEAKTPSSPRSSWLPPSSSRTNSFTPVAKSMEEAKQNASSIHDDQYESFDHKQLKRQNSPTRIDMAGDVMESPLPEKEAKKVTMPSLQTLPKPALKKGNPSTDVKKEKKRVSLEADKKKRPGLEDRTENKRPHTGPPASRRPSPAHEEQRVDEYLDQFELMEQAFRDRKILVTISGAPLFEYKTRVILHDELAFPNEQMVTFHASSQQI